MTQKSNPLKFRNVWTFPEPVEKYIAKFMELHLGLWLHAPAGISKLGKGGFKNNVEVLTLDSDPTVNPDIVGDIFNLKEHTTIQSIVNSPRQGFDGIISDPVWLKVDTCPKCKDSFETTKGLSYPRRRDLSYAIRDILKPGGWWVFNGLWDPGVKGMEITGNDYCKSGLAAPLQTYRSYRNFSLVIFLQRKNEVLSFA